MVFYENGEKFKQKWRKVENGYKADKMEFCPSFLQNRVVVMGEEQETVLRVQKTSVVLLSKNNIQCRIEIYYFHIIKCTQLTKCTLLL